MKDHAALDQPRTKFSDPFVTADGQDRASVSLSDPQTLWFNTGTLCNIECPSCYIASSPTNDALVYLTLADMRPYLDQITQRGWPIREIAFTGGEPFMNNDIIDMAEAALTSGYEVLILTNAMRPMMRPAMQAGLQTLQAQYGAKLTLRVSLDHFEPARHDAERGTGSFDLTLKGMEWLRDQGIRMAVAGRIEWAKSEADARAGFAALYKQHGFEIDAYSSMETVLFPEMDMAVDVPEITTACWGILDKSPDAVMCASSRMVVRRKGAPSPSVLACTLLPYAPEFDMGPTLEDAERPVQLNHPHCAKFCVLGGASCSA